jgi:hypothetical protein
MLFSWQYWIVSSRDFKVYGGTGDRADSYGRIVF